MSRPKPSASTFFSSRPQQRILREPRVDVERHAKGFHCTTIDTIMLSQRLSLNHRLCLQWRSCTSDADGRLVDPKRAVKASRGRREEHFIPLAPSIFIHFRCLKSLLRYTSATETCPTEL